MAGKLSSVAPQIMGGNALVSRSVAASLRQRSGLGLPVGRHIVPDKPVFPVNDELAWDNGDPFPEPCIDRIADTVGKYEALAWLCGGLGFFASLGPLAVWNDEASKIPFTPKVYPDDNLRVNSWWRAAESPGVSDPHYQKHIFAGRLRFVREILLQIAKMHGVDNCKCANDCTL
ncbi:NADH dehydrogenase [Striga hermonthica]|uniref:NADH dehydrogenase n=1 Tax=Striga hermonthica TaxID=68872 RepID=A0A9N7P0E8_STRHE|nr:NADH dehydrogenase [Striga hermonthica]